jgi:hypothetical protein
MSRIEWEARTEQGPGIVICIPDSLMVDYGSKMVVWAAFGERIPARPEGFWLKTSGKRVRIDRVSAALRLCLPAKRNALFDIHVGKIIP